MNKKVFYTCIINDYDVLAEPDEIEEGFDYICFTNSGKVKSKVYKIVQVQNLFQNIAYTARMYKILPHLFLGQYDYSVWHDGRIKIKNKVSDLIDSSLAQNSLAVYPHMLRKDIYEEAKACIEADKDNAMKIIKQISKYRSDKYPPEFGCVETGVLIREHNNPDVIEFSNYWWDQLLAYSKRDQISFSYSAWKNKFKFTLLDNFVWKNDYFEVAEKHQSQIK